MNCAWKDFLAVLPSWMRAEVDKLGADCLRELRLRINSPPELVMAGKRCRLEQTVSREDIQYTVNTASRYSPWAAATAARGYITAKGGHRIGLCGETVTRQGEVTGFGTVTSLCIRVAADYPGIGEKLSHHDGSILILGAPGWGKTTLLRDLVRQISRKDAVCVVDERGELFPPELPVGTMLDVLSGCKKGDGIPMVLRTMGPDTIAVDEITQPEDVQALLHAANCGVRLLATAHAASAADFRRRNVYRPLVENRIFDTLAVLKKDNTYTTERMTEWVTGGLAQL